MSVDSATRFNVVLDQIKARIASHENRRTAPLSGAPGRAREGGEAQDTNGNPAPRSALPKRYTLSEARDAINWYRVTWSRIAIWGAHAPAGAVADYEAAATVLEAIPYPIPLTDGTMATDWRVVTATTHMEYESGSGHEAN